MRRNRSAGPHADRPRNSAKEAARRIKIAELAVARKISLKEAARLLTAQASAITSNEYRKIDETVKRARLEKVDLRHLHLEKQGLRGLAIAESFTETSKKSVLAGIVISTEMVIDGFVFDHSTVGGDDATEVILSMYERLDRPDVSFLLISGIVISLYNIVDVKKISEKIGLPVIGVTYEDSSGIEDAIKHHFPKSYESKLSKYSHLEPRKKITLKTSYDLYIRNEGCTLLEAKQLIDKITLQGSVPEPLRISQMLAKTLLKAKF